MIPNSLLPGSRVDRPPKTPEGQIIDSTTFAALQATPLTDNPDLGKKKSDLSRKDVAQAMNSEMLVCNIVDFMANYGPNPALAPSEDDVDGCKKYLLQHEVLTKVDTQGHDVWSWTNLPMFPSQTGKTEMEAYKPLANIVMTIWEYAGEVQNRKKNPYMFEMVDSNNIEGDIPGTNHKMDACILESSYKNQLINNKIMFPVEIKTEWKKGKQIDVREQIVGDCHHIMCDDPRRKFIYGATIEDDRFSMWYFSRSHSVKALAFKFTSGEGIDRFIGIMLSFAYATPSDFGLDPYVHKLGRRDHDGGQQWMYEFEVDKDFTTASPTAAGPVPTIVEEEPSELGEDALDDDQEAEFSASEEEADYDDEHDPRPPRPTQDETASLPPRVTRSFKTSKPASGKKKIFFRTIRARVPTRPARLSGRSTRIWEVVEVASLRGWDAVPGARSVILKDVWLHADSNTEGQNMDLVFEAVDQFVADGLKANPGPNGIMHFVDKEPRFKEFNAKTKERLAKLLAKKKYRDLFLTKLLEWEGDSSKPATASRLTEKLFKVSSTSGDEGSSSLATGSRMSTHLDMIEDPDKSAVPQAAEVVARREYGQKKQVRILYKEVCKEISSLRTYGEAMDIARQALDALQILYCAGWIHRDISIGNILACRVKNAGEITWQVKLADLEFSRRSGHTKHSSDPRTGTPQFIPVEISQSRYIAYNFLTVEALSTEMCTLEGLPPPEPAELNLATRFLSKGHPDYDHYAQFKPTTPGFEMREKLPPVCVHGSIPADVVSHSYQHDLESLWWIMLYLVMGLSDNPKSTAFAQQIFTRKPAAHARHMTLRDSLVPMNFPLPLFRVFHKRLETLRKLLYEEYVVRAVCGAMSTPDAYSLIHGKFAEQLDEILDTNTNNWKAIRMVRKDREGNKLESSLDAAPFESTKRGFEDLEDPEVSSTSQRLKKTRIE